MLFIFLFESVRQLNKVVPYSEVQENKKHLKDYYLNNLYKKESWEVLIRYNFWKSATDIVFFINILPLAISTIEFWLILSI